MFNYKNEQDSINSIKLKIVFTYGNDGNPYYEGSHNIVYNQDMVLYYSEDSLTSVKQNMESGKTDTVIMRNDNIFIHKEKNDYGFLYSGRDTSNYNEVNKDSMLNSLFSFNEEMFGAKDGQLTLKEENNSTLLESYYFPIKADPSIPYTLNLLFSNKLNDIKFSLSPKQDKIKNKKLVKAEFIFNPGFNDSLSIEVPRRSLIIEIAEIKPDNEKELMMFFENAAMRFTIANKE